MAEQLAFQEGQRETSIEDVFHQDDVLAPHGVVDVLHQFHFPAVLLGVPVARNSNEIEGGIEPDLAGQVRQKDRGALQHSDEYHRFAFKITGDAVAQVGNFLRDLFTCQQDFESVHVPHRWWFARRLDRRESAEETQLNNPDSWLLSCRILEHAVRQPTWEVEACSAVRYIRQS